MNSTPVLFAVEVGSKVYSSQHEWKCLVELLKSLLPLEKMLTPCFKGLILLTTGNAYLPYMSFDGDKTRVFIPGTLPSKDLSIPILNLLHIPMSCFLSLCPDLFCDPPVPHTRITIRTDHCGWNVRQAGPKRNWAAAQTTRFGIWSESLGDLSSSSSLVLIVCIASSAHESIWRLIPTLQRKDRLGGGGIN